MPRRHLIDPTAALNVDFRVRTAKPDTQRNLNFRGLMLEYTRVTSATEYDFSWNGKHHYLALHDLVVEKGEIRVDGMDAVASGDLRNKMTYMPAGRPFEGWARTTGRQNSFTVLHFEPGTLSEETGRMLNDQDNLPIIHFEDAAIQSTMRKLDAVIADGADFPSIYVETLALLAALEIGRLQGNLKAASDRTGRLSAAQEALLRDYVESSLSQDITLDDLAQLVRLSRFHLARRFKATFGITPYRFVIDRRLDLAKRLLRETTMSVGEIALATGFGSAGPFIKAFKASTGGLTPLIYRKR